MNSSKIKPYSKAIVKLLKGIVEKNDVVWNDVLNYQSDIQNYIAVMGLELIVKKALCSSWNDDSLIIKVISLPILKHQ